MRILQLTGPVEGGILRHVEALARGLPAERMECGLAGPVKPAWPASNALHQVPWTSVAMDDRMLSALAPHTALALRTVWQREGWDLVHAHGYKATVLAWLASRASPRLSYVATLHNLCPPTGRLGRILLRSSLRGARRVIGVSHAVLESLGAALGRQFCGEVVPNGVDCERFADLPSRALVRRAMGLSDERVILFLGRLTAEKGVLVLADAAAALAEADRQIVVWVAGEGPERERLETAARVTPALRVLGPRDDVPALMSACDLVVVPSLREGQSLVALEAMAAGRPLVVSAVGGLAELARASAAAWSVAPGNAAELAQVLGTLMAQPETRAELGARGQVYARRHGDWSAMVHRVAAVYRAALEKP